MGWKRTVVATLGLYLASGCAISRGDSASMSMHQVGVALDTRLDTQLLVEAEHPPLTPIPELRASAGCCLMPSGPTVLLPPSGPTILLEPSGPALLLLPDV